MVVTVLNQLHAEQLAALACRRDERGVSFHHDERSLPFRLKNLKRPRIKSWCNDAIGYNALEELGSRDVDYFRNSRKVPEGAFRISAPRAHVGHCARRELLALYLVRFHELGCKRLGDCCTRGRHMLKRRGRCQARGDPRFADKLPGIQSVEKVDETGSAVQYTDR